MAGRHGLLFRFALFVFQAVQQGSEVLDFAAQSQHPHFFVAQPLFQFSELAQHIAQLALHGERAFGALPAAGHGHVVEAFARLREKERIGIFQRQLAGESGIGNDVAIAQFGKNDFQRSAKSVEHANRILQRDDRPLGLHLMRVFVDRKRKLRLRILGMHQEGGAAIHVGAEQTQAFVRRIP